MPFSTCGSFHFSWGQREKEIAKLVRITLISSKQRCESCGWQGMTCREAVKGWRRVMIEAAEPLKDVHEVACIAVTGVTKWS